ncbi:MAG: putative amidohydrolase YtcJ [Phycisphaerales bacterium]|jgi:predicted amidohydrolase YtcJ
MVPDRPAFGLCESHAHLGATGRAMSMCDLSTARTATEMLETISAFAPDASGWVLAHGARPEAWETPEWPSREELDAAAGNRPAMVWCFDYHAILASTAAMEHAGLNAHRKIPRGKVELDALGDPTGVVLERAAWLMWAAVPSPSKADRVEHVAAALSHLADLGFAQVHDLKAELWLGPVLAQLEREDRLPCRVKLFPLVENLSGVAASSADWVSDSISLGGGKLFTDGTFNSRTAWMLEPYADGSADHPCGMPMVTQAGIEHAVRTCDSLGLPLAAHAIGDAAVRAVLDAIETVQPSARGQRIEHAELIDEADVPRFAQLGVVCSPQPCHLLADIEALHRAVPDRLDRVMPLRELVDSGLVPGESLIFGSDIPIVRADPEDSILAATARRRADMPESESISPTQSLSDDEAWRCFLASPV